MSGLDETIGNLVTQVAAETAERMAAQVAQQLKEAVAEVAAASAATPADDPWMPTKAAAAYLGLKPNTLEIMRTKGGGPVYSKPTNATVLYRRSALDAWACRNELRSTSEETAKGNESAAPGQTGAARGTAASRQPTRTGGRYDDRQRKS